MSYDVFKSFESRVSGAEETIKLLNDDVAIIKENIRELQQNCASNEELRNLISRIEIVEDKIRLVSESFL